MTTGATPTLEHCDALVIGGNVAGLTTALFLANWGFDVRVFEKSTTPGSFDRSFTNSQGRVFDYGLHVLDHMRSRLVTRIFESVLEGKVNKIERKRGIVLRNHQIRYNAPPEEWPDELRTLLPEGAIVDELGSDPPTRENLRRCYGDFADLIFDEGLPSYPAEARQLDFGIDEWRLMVNIYPWFFPRAMRARLQTNASRIYQDQIRSEKVEYMLYPSEGGFGTFPNALVGRLKSLGTSVHLGASDLHCEVNPESCQVEWVETRGRRYTAPRVYWCGDPGGLYRLLSRPVPRMASDRFVLGSFQFERPIRCDFNELIFADPQHLINRAAFRGKFALEPDDLVQLEFAYPEVSELYHHEDVKFWHESWLGSLRRLGIVAADNAVVDFELKSFPLCYNCYGIEGEPLPKLDFSDIPAQSNLRPVLPTVAKININTRVPQYLRFLAEDLALP